MLSFYKFFGRSKKKTTASLVKLALWLFIFAKGWSHNSAPACWVCAGKTPACGTLLSSHLVLKTGVPQSVHSILHSCYFMTHPFSLWLLLCFLVSSSFLCSVPGAAVPCGEQAASYQRDHTCVCVCRIPVWVSLVQQWNSHLVSVLLPASPNWRAPFLLEVSHSLWWVINVPDRVTTVILWAFFVPLVEFQCFT